MVDQLHGTESRSGFGAEMLTERPELRHLAAGESFRFEFNLARGPIFFGSNTPEVECEHIAGFISGEDGRQIARPLYN
jgi:hypothetical protein